MKTINLTETRQVEKILKVAEKIFDLKEGLIKSSSRKQYIHLPRMAISNLANIEKGIHYNTIGDVLNRDRTSIYHYTLKHQELYGTWQKYRNTFNELYSACIKEGKKCLKRFEIKKILDKNKIYGSSGKVTIVVTSGFSSYKLSSDYKDFTGKIEKIKFVLKKYSHDISITL